jgi:hypothetical protein
MKCHALARWDRTYFQMLYGAESFLRKWQSLTSQETPRLLPNSWTIHYHVHKSPPLVPILSQTNPIHNPTTYSFNIHFNNIFPPTPRSFEWSLPFRFTNQNCVCISHSSRACYISHPSHPPWFDHPNDIWRSVRVMKLLIMQISSLSLQQIHIPQHLCSDIRSENPKERGL